MKGYPLRYAHSNVLFSRRSEPCALYRIEPASYPFRPKADKLGLFSQLISLIVTVGADFSLWRVERPISTTGYRQNLEALRDPLHGRPEALAELAAGHEHHIEALSASRPEIYLAVSLETRSEAALGKALLQGADKARRRLEALLDSEAPQPILASSLDALLASEELTFGRLSAVLGSLVSRASTKELLWLMRRAATRGVSEPRLDPHFEPDALIVMSDSGEIAYEPVEKDLLRLTNADLCEHDRRLQVIDEDGRSHQAMLALGALPEQMLFPGRAELLCTPLEALEFPVDTAIRARHLANKQMLGQVRRRVIDADNAFVEELRSEHGPLSFAAQERREHSRELQAYLESSARPPMLAAQIYFALGAETKEALEGRVDQLREAYQPVALHRPAGVQQRIYVEHLPQPGSGGLPDYEEMLTVEQFAGLMPIGTSHVGSPSGFYIGHLASGARRPVLFDPTDAPRAGRAPAVLLAGTLGSGKTLAAELFAYLAERRGSLICTIDPKGDDHALWALPELQGRSQLIELSGEVAYEGLLDPLRVAPEQIREDIATSYLAELLPAPDPSWQTHLRRAVREASARGGDCAEVLALLLDAKDPEAVRVGEALEVWAASGLGRLAFGQGDGEIERDIDLTTICARALQLPGPGTARADYTPAERVSVATLGLVATYAMALSSSPDRHAVVLMDEAWAFLSTTDGRRTLERLARLGRSQNTTLLLATQQLADIGELDNLIGTRLVFGMESAAEARRGASLLGLDPDDSQLVERIRSQRKGRCLMRDVEGSVGEVQIDLVFDDLLTALDTSPEARSAGAVDEEERAA